MKVVKERVGKVLGAIAVSAMAMVLICTMGTASKENEVQASAEETLLYSSAEAMSYAKKQFSGYSNVQGKSLSRRVLYKSNNYKQENIRTQYNFRFLPGMGGVYIPSNLGICWSSANATVMNFYGAKADPIEMGVKCIEAAIYADWFHGNDGLNNNEAMMMYNHMAAYYKILGNMGFAQLNKANKKDEMYEVVVKAVNAGDVCSFSVPSHVMTACGYAYCDISYTKKVLFVKKNKTEKVRFIVVNDTWENNKVRQFSYYPIDAIEKRNTNYRLITFGN